MGLWFDQAICDIFHHMKDALQSPNTIVVQFEQQTSPIGKRVAGALATACINPFRRPIYPDNEVGWRQFHQIRLRGEKADEVDVELELLKFQGFVEVKPFQTALREELPLLRGLVDELLRGVEDVEGATQKRSDVFYTTRALSSVEKRLKEYDNNSSLAETEGKSLTYTVVPKLLKHLFITDTENQDVTKEK